NKEANNVIDESKEKLLPLIDEQIKDIENKLKLVQETIQNHNNDLTINDLNHVECMVTEANDKCSLVKKNLDNIKIKVDNEVKHLNIYRTIHVTNSIGNIAQGANAIHTMYKLGDALSCASDRFKIATFAVSAVFTGIAAATIAAGCITHKKIEELQKIGIQCEELRTKIVKYEKDIVQLKQYFQRSSNQNDSSVSMN
ncbi:unnamed protein product, partial [Didymodactylos carnosus]